MDLVTKLLLCQFTNRHQEDLRESIVDVSLVVLDSRLRVLQMLDVVEHIERVSQCHQEVVHLIKPLPIAADVFQEVGDEHAVPVEEPATGRLAHNHFPAAHHLQLVVPVLNIVELGAAEDGVVDEVEAVRNDRLPQLVVAALVRLNDDEHQLGHVVLDGPLLHVEDVLHAALQLLRDELARVPIDQDHPLVDEELLGFELDLDRL